MQKKPLIELIHDLEQEMLRLGYSNGSMQLYRGHWKKLLQIAQERGESFYSEDLGIEFVEKYFSIFKNNFNQTLSPSQTQNLRIIRMIGDFQLHHAISRRYRKQEEILTNPYFITISNRFKSYCSNKGYSKTTIGHYSKQSERFMDYLVSQNVTKCGEINLSLIHEYIKTLAGYSYKTYPL